jgi:deoxycytidine triphosphate deaminase
VTAGFRRMVQEHDMINPYSEKQVSEGVISYGVSSYGYDLRVAKNAGCRFAVIEVPRFTFYS